MERLIKMIALVVALVTINCDVKAQDGEWDYWTNDWMVSASYGGLMAFGDDSYNIFQEWNEANGYNLSLSVGKMFSPVVGMRLKGRLLGLNSRVSLEAYNEQMLAQYFPNKGFYHYRGLGAQLEVLLNVTNMFRSNKLRAFNLYLVAGGGINKFYHYDSHVEDWTQEAGKLPGGWYYVDTADHVMGSGVIGGIIELRLSRHVALNVDAMCTFTGDMMEGVKYEEWYDAYVTYSAGMTFYF